jgi:hypothetical protein
MLLDGIVEEEEMAGSDGILCLMFALFAHKSSPSCLVDHTTTSTEHISRIIISFLSFGCVT